MGSEVEVLLVASKVDTTGSQLVVGSVRMKGEGDGWGTTVCIGFAFLLSI